MRTPRAISTMAEVATRSAWASSSTRRRASWSEPAIVFSETARVPSSSSLRTGTRRSRRPAAISCASELASRSGRTMNRTSSASAAVPSASAISSTSSPMRAAVPTAAFTRSRLTATRTHPTCSRRGREAVPPASSSGSSSGSSAAARRTTGAVATSTPSAATRCDEV